MTSSKLKAILFRRYMPTTVLIAIELKLDEALVIYIRIQVVPNVALQVTNNRNIIFNRLIDES